ncbi:MAG: hypothetical protein H6741_18470 [Alphaproteobacteria bacterium]|nr:hypothetical protein [Alphaproteobacteria bacterium]MCB9794701.1 hypothetical protein [Alphaproteobacteria bacterium]
MLIRTLTMTAILALAGCDQGFGGFNEGGNSNDPELFDDDTGDGSAQGDPDAPEILELILEFDDYANIGIVLEIVAAVDDPQDDLLNGQVFLRITPASSGETTELSYDINNTDARLLDGDVMLAIQGVEETESYEVTLKVIDAAGHESEAVTSSI